MKSLRPSSPPPYVVIEPQRRTLPFVYNVPHSGRFYPPDFLAMSSLSLHDLRSGEDCLVDHLISAVAGLGATVLVNSYARAYIDTNRDAQELDPRIIEPPLPEQSLIRSERVAAGLGVIPAITGGNQAIYRRPLPLEVVERRLKDVYHPVHAALRQLIKTTVDDFGYCVMVDCHSMPGITPGKRRSGPDIVLGDRYGASCAVALVQTATEAFEALGYTVAYNTPYAGGHNTEHYGAPGRGIHVMQIEINRGLYLDEREYALSEKANAFNADLMKVFAALHRLPADTLRPLNAKDGAASLPLRLSAE